MSETGTDGAQTPEEQSGSGKLSRRKVLGGMAAGAGAAAVAGLAASCGSKDGATAGGDGPPGYGTGINEGFDGKIELDVRDSTPDWKPFELKKAPEGAPNVLVVLYDDTGLAAWSPYGGRINMPVMQTAGRQRADVLAVAHHRAVLTDPLLLPHRSQPARQPLRVDH